MPWCSMPAKGLKSQARAPVAQKVTAPSPESRMPQSRGQINHNPSKSPAQAMLLLNTFLRSN